MVKKFYAYYVATLWGFIDKRARPTKHDSLTSVLIQGYQVNSYEAIIHTFLYDTTTNTRWSQSTSEFNYQWEIVKSGTFKRTAEQ